MSGPGSESPSDSGPDPRRRVDRWSLAMTKAQSIPVQGRVERFESRPVDVLSTTDRTLVFHPDLFNPDPRKGFHLMVNSPLGPERIPVTREREPQPIAFSLRTRQRAQRAGEVLFDLPHPERERRGRAMMDRRRERNERQGRDF